MSERAAAEESLPSVIPVFPLSGVLLLPRAQLPLNIFEPRYLAMVRDAIEGEGIIGMAQPREGGWDTEPPLYSVGCAGRITACEKTDDGRFLITLTGIARFRIVEELARTTPYRQVVADFESFAGDRLTPLGRAGIDRQALIEGLKRYLDRRGLSADWDAIAKAPDEALVNSLASICPFGPAEKQALLETDSLTERTRTMIALMEMSDDGAGRRH